MKRIAEHERNYEPVEEMDIPWIRLVNVGEKIQINVGDNGYLSCRHLTGFLLENSRLPSIANCLFLNEYPQPASFYLFRSGT